MPVGFWKQRNSSLLLQRFLSYWAYTLCLQFVSHIIDMDTFVASKMWISLALVFSVANLVPQMLFMPFVAHSWRLQLRDLESLQRQLAVFQFDRDVSCHCCDINHVHPATGNWG